MGEGPLLSLQFDLESNVGRGAIRLQLWLQLSYDLKLLSCVRRTAREDRRLFHIGRNGLIQSSYKIEIKTTSNSMNNNFCLNVNLHNDDVECLLIVSKWIKLIIILALTSDQSEASILVEQRGVGIWNMFMNRI